MFKNILEKLGCIVDDTVSARTFKNKKVLIVGDKGTGKTWLINSFVERYKLNTTFIIDDIVDFNEPMQFLVGQESEVIVSLNRLESFETIKMFDTVLFLRNSCFQTQVIAKAYKISNISNLRATEFKLLNTRGIK